MNTFRILVADDHPIFRLGLCSLLGSHEGWEVCGEAADGREAIEKCKRLKPDLLILDICMPKLNGDAARQILRNEGRSGRSWSRRTLAEALGGRVVTGLRAR